MPRVPKCKSPLIKKLSLRQSAPDPVSPGESMENHSPLFHRCLKMPKNAVRRAHPESARDGSGIQNAATPFSDTLCFCDVGKVPFCTLNDATLTVASLRRFRRRNHRRNVSGLVRRSQKERTERTHDRHSLKTESSAGMETYSCSVANPAHVTGVNSSLRTHNDTPR